MKASELFDRIHELPKIPQIVQELLQSFNDPDANIDDISNKIVLDPVISAKVLRLANSAHFSKNREVKSIDDAVVRLGFDTLRTLVVASGVTTAFKEIPGFDRNKFWQQSFRVAQMCKALARKAGIRPDVAYTCGMMHRIGEPMLFIADPENAAQACADMENGLNLLKAQKLRIGCNYVEVGAELTARWRFPDEIVEAVRLQARPVSGGKESPEAALLNLVAMTNDCWEKGIEDEQLVMMLPESPLHLLGLDGAELISVLTPLKEQSDEIAAMLAA